MSLKRDPGMSRAAAFRIEVGIIDLGVAALLMIFQPFALPIFSVGCGLVVLAALANNLLPLAQPGAPLRGVIFAALIVALVFCVVVVLSIASAHLYGVIFLNPRPDRLPWPAVLVPSSGLVVHCADRLLRPAAPRDDAEALRWRMTPRSSGSTSSTCSAGRSRRSPRAAASISSRRSA